MAALKLGSYILDHDKKSFLIEDGEVKEIEYSSGGEVKVEGENRSELLEIDNNKYKDFKISFDELNFENEEESVTKLEKLSKDIAGIEINKTNKTVTSHKKMRIDNGFDKLSAGEQQIQVRKYIQEEYKGNEKLPGVQVLSWERAKDGWGNEVVDIKLKKRYGRVENMEGNIISIHTQSREEALKGESNYKVKPHIHITIPKNNNWGKDFCYLRKEINNKLVDHELTSSDNSHKYDKSNKTYGEYKTLKDRLSNFSWVVAKHEDPYYAMKQLNQYRGKNCITLDNVEFKVNRYLELGGSFDFARKLQTNLKEKLDIDIALKAPESYLKAEQNIKEGNHRAIITDVCQRAIRGEKISERYKEYAKEVLNTKPEVNDNDKDYHTARAIRDIVRTRGYKLDRNWNKVIDKDKINEIAEHYKAEIDRSEVRQRLEGKIENREYLNQSELREDLKQAGVKDITEVSDLSESAIVFQSNEKYIKENLDYSQIDSPITAYKEIKVQIKAMSLNITEKWENKIAYKICEEKGYINKAKEKIKAKIDRARAVNSSYQGLKQSYKEARKKMKELAGEDNDTISNEMNKIENQSREIIRILRSLERMLEGLDNLNFKDLSDTKEIDKQIDNHEDILAGHESKLDNIIKDEQEIKDEIKLLKNKIRNLEKKEKTLVEHSRKLYGEEFEMLGSYTLQYYENEVKQDKDDLENLEEQKGELEKDLKKAGLRSKVTGKKKKLEKKLEEIENKIGSTENRLKKHEKIVKEANILRDDRIRTDEAVAKLYKIRKEKNNELKKILKSLGIKPQKSKSRSWGMER
ncbi:hypothetical protein [Halonatronum saccharophilum]|uniref:hypothetical protein n=1 Tax=Halonatronum saccharophilum TaxID=150060 RepID=UPI000484E39B|nr:hypothetical protein [Halonatronum saccharophilum]